MRKVLGVLAVSAAIGLSLFGCEGAPGPTKPTPVVGTPVQAGGAATVKGGTPSTVAPEPVANPEYHGAVGSKVK